MNIWTQDRTAPGSPFRPASLQSHHAAGTRFPGDRTLVACTHYTEPVGVFLYENAQTLPGLDPRTRARQTQLVTSDLDATLLIEIQADIHRYVDAVLDSTVNASSSERTPHELLAQLKLAPAEDAPESLITRIAREDAGRLESVCKDPRVLLRRERRRTPLSRVRQLDPACLRWLDRQPGLNMLDKAGLRQEILSIGRRRSLDTLENRVLKDCLRRAVLAAQEYERENSRFAQSEKVKLVFKFRRLLVSLQRDSGLAAIPTLSSIPAPNYVLQSEVRYRYVWKTWQRLLRREQLTQSLLLWGSRWHGELAYVATLAALSELGSQIPMRKQLLWVRPDPTSGEFCDPSTPIGTLRVATATGHAHFDIARSSQLARGYFPEKWKTWVDIAPDFLIAPREGETPPLLVWAVVTWNPAQAENLRWSLPKLRWRLQQIQGKGLVLWRNGTEWSEGPLRVVPFKDMDQLIALAPQLALQSLGLPMAGGFA